ncbi:MAG: alpha-L-fucosidase [Bacteroidales bacterium]|nr:alpha-L-fucosidase [Bacteroidales bacterium]
MRFVFFALLMFLTSFPIFSQEKYIPSAQNMASRREFSQARFGIFIHWGIYSMLGDGEWVMHNKNINYKEYEKLAAGFYPSKFNAAEWVKAIKGSGAKYICITSRHHDGFSIFNTKASGYNVVDATPFKRDILAEIAQECHKQGIRLHIYYSHIDWGREDYYPVGRTGRGTGRTGHFQGKKLPELDSSKFQTNWAYENYLKFMDQQLTELLTNYGPVGAIWFDGLWDRDKQEDGLKAETWNLDNQYALIHKLQPGCLVGNNHHMDPFPGEDIQIFERDIPGQNLYGYSEQAISTMLPLETCQTMNRSWGYRITDTTYKSEEFLIKYLVQTAAKGANLLLNIGPRPDGTLPDESLQRLEAMGRWMGKFGETIYGTTAGIVPEQPWGVSTRKGHRNFLFVFKDTSEVFVPLEDTDIVESRDYAAGTHLEYRRVKDGIRISLGNAGAPSNGIRVVEFTYDPVDNEALEASVVGFLKKYPQATLQDVYKNNFQDYFGPAHIMAKREGVVRYLQQELEEMKQEGYLSGRGYYDPCGWRNNYYQVSLAVVADGLMTLDEFADAFIAGGGAVPEVTDEWMQEWKLIKKAVKKAAPAIVGYGKDAAAIDSLIKDGKYVVHHSNRYVETYKPHYRIMRRDIFNALVYPRIKASGKN